MPDDPLAYFLTWTTHGTWLPGDDRGWAKRGKGFQEPSTGLRLWNRAKLAAAPVVLTSSERDVVERTINAHCEFRGWSMHAVAVRTNHVHVVVSAPNHPDDVLEKLKTRCARLLSEDPAKHRKSKPPKWWSERGSTRYLNDEASLESAIRYVVDAQQGSRFENDNDKQ
jgi:REP element-mobilizing transposase RayT